MILSTASRSLYRSALVLLLSDSMCYCPILCVVILIVCMSRLIVVLPGLIVLIVGVVEIVGPLY